MVFMKMIHILGLFKTILIQINASHISSINKEVEINTESSTNFEISIEGGHSKISSDFLETQMFRTIACHSPKDKQEVVGCFLSEIILHTLKDENIFLLYDRELMNLYGWIEDFLFRNLKQNPHISLELQEFDISNIDAEVISGSKYTTICLLYNQKVLIDFLINRTMDTKWAPTKLFTVFLDHEPSISDVIFDFLVQRSKYIFIAELTTKIKKFVFKTYSISPFPRFKNGLTQWKVFKEIYKLPRKKNEIFVERNQNFGGRLLRLASICDDPPLLFMDNTKKCVGVNIEILNIISKALNFQYNVPEYTQNGTWDGIGNDTIARMLRDLYHNNIDLIINYLIPGEKEHPYFDFSFPYLYDGFGFLCKNPDLVPVWRKIFLPFSVSMWSLLLTTVMLLILITFFMMKFGSRGGNKFKLSTAFLQVYGIMLRQDSRVTLKSSWYLIFLLAWIIGSFVITSAYSGSLISSMTVRIFEKQIETVREIINSNLRVGAYNFGHSIKEGLLDSPIEDLRELGKKFEYYSIGENNYSRIIELIKSNHHVFTDGNIFLIDLQEYFNITNETYVLKEQINKGYVSFIFKKHSPLTDPISSKLNRLVETGIYSKIYEICAMIRPRETLNKINERQPLKIVHLQTAFYGLFLGYFISLMIFVFEILTNG